MVVALMIIGSTLLLASLWARGRNNSLIATDMPHLWQTLWRFRWAFGLFLSIASYFMRYPLQGSDGVYTVYGVPYMTYAFDEKGHDYVGTLTMPFMILNFVFWLFLPHLLFWLSARFSSKQER